MPPNTVAEVIDLTGDDAAVIVAACTATVGPTTGQKRAYQHTQDPGTRDVQQVAARKTPRTVKYDSRTLQLGPPQPVVSSPALLPPHSSSANRPQPGSHVYGGSNFVPLRAPLPERGQYPSGPMSYPQGPQAGAWYPLQTHGQAPSQQPMLVPTPVRTPVRTPKQVVNYSVPGDEKRPAIPPVRAQAPPTDRLLPPQAQFVPQGVAGSMDGPHVVHSYAPSIAPDPPATINANVPTHPSPATDRAQPAQTPSRSVPPPVIAKSAQKSVAMGTRVIATPTTSKAGIKPHAPPISRAPIRTPLSTKSINLGRAQFSPTLAAKWKGLPPDNLSSTTSTHLQHPVQTPRTFASRLSSSKQNAGGADYGHEPETTSEEELFVTEVRKVVSADQGFNGRKPESRCEEEDFSGIYTEKPDEYSARRPLLVAKRTPRLTKHESPTDFTPPNNIVHVPSHTPPLTAKATPETPSAVKAAPSSQRPSAVPTPSSIAGPCCKCYAVRVGWFPGIYEVKDHCRYLTMHYPQRETERFESRQAAQAWLDEDSPAATRDAKARPPNYRNVDRAGWIHFLERTWVARSAEASPCSKVEVLKKLRLLFTEASELDEQDEVDWAQHPLPQQLLRRDQQCDFVQAFGLNGDYVRQKDEFLAPKHLCSCGAPAPSGNGVVTCQNPTCERVNYHKRCVGLASRPDTTGWRCRHCRPVILPWPSQQPPPYSTQGQRPTTPPLPYSTQLPAAAKPVINGPAEPSLAAEQAKVVNYILSGQNVFYTGSAGTGKSTVLKAFVAEVRQAGKHVDIVAPSGIAALNVGGTTIFSYAGWVPDSFKDPISKLAEKAHGKVVHKRLCRTDVLVIDEISMVENHMLQRLDAVMRSARSTFKTEHGPDGKWIKQRSKHNAKEPFGGVQVVVTGDFCQLPPVKPFAFCIHCGGEEMPRHNAQDGRLLRCPRCRTEHRDEDKWAFRSPVWEQCNFQCFELRQIHRQSEDARFIEILQRCRFGIPFTPEDKALLLREKPDPVGAVQLLPRRAEVESVNLREYNNLSSRPRQYQCLDFFKHRSHDQPELKRYAFPRYASQLDGPLQALKDHRFEEQIRLKQGMLVILLVNLDFTQGLVNGSQGRIIGFEPHDDARVMASLFPQLDRFPSSPPNPKSKSASSAAAAATSTKGLSELQHVRKEQIQKFMNQQAVREWPIVQFHNGITQPIYPQCQVNELGLDPPYSFLGRTQVPLLAAWAITVHKSQGMTLNRVIVDLYNSFEREMVYVALSRARGLAGLKVRRLAREAQASKMKSVNEEVHGFLRRNDLLGGNA